MEFVTFIVTPFTKNQINSFISKCIYLVLRDRKAGTWRMHNIKIINVEKTKST
jgi:hypothetical protein